MANQTSYDRRRIDNFGRRITPLVRSYLNDNGPGSIMAVPTAGRLFALELYRRLLTPSGEQPYVDITYFEANKDELEGSLEMNSPKIRERHLIVVDDDIHTKQTYEEIQYNLERLKEKYGIRSINWAVEFDGPGIATWACNRINNGNRVRV